MSTVLGRPRVNRVAYVALLVIGLVLVAFT